MSKLQTWQGVQDQLTEQRATLNQEIAVYPGPITGCDAQFNHMLELRSGLNAQLVLLTRMSAGADARTLKQFVESCPFLGGSNGEKQ